MAFPEYPKDLEYATWDKKKAPLTPETGIGKELKALKASYDKIDTDAFTKLETAKSADDIEAALKKAEAEYNKSIKPYHKDLLDFVRKVDGEVTKAKKAMTFPKKSRELMESMSTTTSNFATTMRDAPDNMKKAADKRLEEREKKIKEFGDTRNAGAQAATRYLSEIAEVHKDGKVEAKALEDLAEEASTAAREGNAEQAAKIGRDADKHVTALNKLGADNDKIYKDMMADKVIAKNRTEMKPSALGLTLDDVAEFGNVWNQAVEKIRLITDHYSQMNALVKEALVDAQTARNAVAHAARSAGDWVKDIEALVVDAKKEAQPVEELAKKVLGRGTWLAEARKGAADEAKKPAIVNQAKAIISEIESNMGRVAERCGAIQRQMQKQLKAMPPALQRERAVKPVVDEARSFYMRLDMVAKKTEGDGGKVIGEYQQFIAQNGG